jgi:soluble lytic murein transglycosylase-like protein
MGLVLLACGTATHARTIYRCERDGSVSLATAAEPGSLCQAQEVDDRVAVLPNIWGRNGKQSGALFKLALNGETIYTTRPLPSAIKVASFVVTPPDVPAHVGLGFVARPRTDIHAPFFAAAARANDIDDAWLRAIAHAESNFRANARSRKGAKGIMQLMPDTASRFRVKNPYSPKDSIAGGARYLGKLLRRFDGDRRLAAAAYNAGPGNVTKYGGVPPFAETQAYVVKVEALYALYQTALSTARVAGALPVRTALK